MVAVRSRGRRSNVRWGTPRNKFDVARLGASGGIGWDGRRRTFSTWGSLKFCAWTSLWISRALCGRMGRGSQASVGQREEGRWRNGCHHPHGFVFEISAVRGAGRWAHYSQVRLYPVRRALRRIINKQHPSRTGQAVAIHQTLGAGRGRGRPGCGGGSRR